MSSRQQLMSRQPYWRELLRALKKTVLGRKSVSLLGSKFRVAYEARKVFHNDTDYPVLKAFASGKHCVFDVGANVGKTTLLMASNLAPGGKLYAFEASEAACLVIQENILLNNFENVVYIINAVLWDKPGCLVDFGWDFVCGSASVVFSYPGRKNTKLAKAATSLDEVSKERGLRPDFVKIDVEGAEVRVVQGMRGLLQSVRPEVVVELHAWPGVTQAQQASDLLAVVRQAKYQMVRLDSREVIRDGSEFDQAETNKSPYSRCWVLLVPQEK